MFFPIGDDQVEGGHPPILSYGLIIVNVAIFLFQTSLSPDGLNNLVYTYGVVPTSLLEGHGYYTLITSMFLHGGWMHLIGNMLFLWVFSDNIEAIIGSGKFILFYLLGGMVAMAAHAFFNPGSDVPSIGASGAISAVLGAYLVMFPDSRVRVLVLLFFFSFRVPAIVFLGIWIVQQFFNGISTLGVSAADTSGVAWWAHIGGFVFGILAGFRYRRLVERTDLAQEED